MLKYFRPITHKKDAPEDKLKDPPEGKELSNLSWPYLCDNEDCDSLL